MTSKFGQLPLNPVETLVFKESTLRLVYAIPDRCRDDTHERSAASRRVPTSSGRAPSENCAFEVMATFTIRTIRTPVADEEISADVKVFTGLSSLALALLRLHTETCKSKHVHLHAIHRIMILKNTEWLMD